MIEVQPITIEGIGFTAITVKLPKTNFMAVTGADGYIMCGALDVALLNEKLKDRGILAGRAVGVRTIEQLLEAPLESVTLAAEEKGVKKGTIGREAMLLLHGLKPDK
ncbi:YunC family protein [Alkalihalobacillus sp. NPDC078783]